jgi:hypothetical protein
MATCAHTELGAASEQIATIRSKTALDIAKPSRTKSVELLFYGAPLPKKNSSEVTPMRRVASVHPGARHGLRLADPRARRRSSVSVTQLALALALIGALLTACAPEVGTPSWCEALSAKPKQEWTGDEVEGYVKACLLGTSNVATE